MCVAMIMIGGGFAAAHRGPYTVETFDGLVQIDPTYQNWTQIVDLPSEVVTIEYSVDGYIYGVDTALDTLLKIDPISGTVETVGPLGIDLDWHADLDEDETGTLWMLESVAGGLYTVDRTTGAATLQCQTDFPYVSGLAISDGRWWTTWLDSPNPPPPSPGCGLDFLWDDPSNVSQLESAADGWVYVQSVWWVPTFGFFVFSRYDPETGAVEDLGGFISHFGGLSGITFDPNDQPSPAIPVLSRPGIAILILLLTGAGTWILLRRG